MVSARPFIVALDAVDLSGHPADAHVLSRYRGYVLEATVESLLAQNGARATDVKTLYERPARIRELEWRAPYMTADATRSTRSGISRSAFSTMPCIR